MSKEKEMNPSSQMVFDMAKIFLDIQTSSFESGMKHAKEDAEREQKMQDFADKCERDIGEKPIKMYKVTIIWGTEREEETSYAFETQKELDAFLLGIAECDGWWEYEIKEEPND